MPFITSELRFDRLQIALRDRFAETRFMGRVARDILRLLLGTEPATVEDSHALWDESLGAVDGGRNWDADAAWFLERADYATILGPNIDDQVPF